MFRVVGDFKEFRGDIAERAVAPLTMDVGGELMVGERAPGGVRRVAIVEGQEEGYGWKALPEKSACGRDYLALQVRGVTVSVARR